MLGPRRVHIGAGKNGVSTHTLDHHSATPIGGLGSRYLLHIMDHHGADAVCVPIAAMGERMVMRPSRPCLAPGATGVAKSRRPSPFYFSLFKTQCIQPSPSSLCPTAGEGWLRRET